MEVKRIVCDVCGAEAIDEKQMRHENWIHLAGQIQVWLENPRTKNQTYMHTISYENSCADFCSIACLTKALQATESLP